MAQTVTFTVDPKGGIKALAGLFEPRGRKSIFAARRVLTDFDRIGKRLADTVIKTKLSGKPLKRRTGTLAKSVTGGLAKVDGLPGVSIGVFRGPALAYAGVQEYGTVGKGGDLPDIRPKNGKALAIPVGKRALTAAGVSRYDGPRSYVPAGGLQFIPSQTIVGLLVDKRDFNDDGSFTEPQYLLVAKVSIAPKRYLRDTMTENLPRVADLMAQSLAKEVRRRIGT